jgi:hypothetical protein
MFALFAYNLNPNVGPGDCGEGIGLGFHLWRWGESTRTGPPVRRHFRNAGLPLCPVFPSGGTRWQDTGCSCQIRQLKRSASPTFHSAELLPPRWRAGTCNIRREGPKNPSGALCRACSSSLVSACGLRFSPGPTPKAVTNDLAWVRARRCDIPPNRRGNRSGSLVTVLGARPLLVRGFSRRSGSRCRRVGWFGFRLRGCQPGFSP